MSFSEFSIGCGAMNFPPDVFSKSFLRSVTNRNPSSSSLPISPVLNHPSENASRCPRVDSSIRQKTEGPRTRISESSAICTSTFESGRPTVPILCATGVFKRNDRRRFRQAITFVDANPDVRVPFRQLNAEGSSTRNEQLGIATHSGAHLRIHQSICQLPTQRRRDPARQYLGSMFFSHRKRPVDKWLASEIRWPSLPPAGRSSRKRAARRRKCLAVTSRSACGNCSMNGQYASVTPRCSSAKST